MDESPLAAAALAHGELLPEAGLFLFARLFGRLLGGLEHVEQVRLDAGLVGVQLHVPLIRFVRVLAVDERLLQVAHHLLPDRLLHGQVSLDVLPVVVLRVALVVVVVCSVLLAVSVNESLKMIEIEIAMSQRLLLKASHFRTKKQKNVRKGPVKRKKNLLKHCAMQLFLEKMISPRVKSDMKCSL